MIDWKNNYVIKAVTNKPVLFITACFISSFLTYHFTTTQLNTKCAVAMEERVKVYESEAESKTKEIRELELKVLTLKTTLTEMESEKVETFDPVTGNRLKTETRKSSNISEREKKRSEAKEIIDKETVAKEKTKLVEKEVLVREPRKKWGHTGGVVYDDLLRTSPVPDAIYVHLDYHLDFFIDRVGFGVEVSREFNLRSGRLTLTKECSKAFCLP